MGKTLEDRGIDPHADPEDLSLEELYHSVEAWRETSGPQGQLRFQELDRELYDRVAGLVSTEEVPVYLHRDGSGFAFVSFGNDSNIPIESERHDSFIEAVEGMVFEQPWADEWLGPSPSEAELMGRTEIEEAGHLPTEHSRTRMYQVGTVKLDDGQPQSVQIHYPSPIYVV